MRAPRLAVRPYKTIVAGTEGNYPAIAHLAVRQPNVIAVLQPSATPPRRVVLVLKCNLQVNNLSAACRKPSDKHIVIPECWIQLLCAKTVESKRSVSHHGPYDFVGASGQHYVAAAGQHLLRGAATWR